MGELKLGFPNGCKHCDEGHKLLIHQHGEPCPVCELRAENVKLRASVLNQCGDNHCHLSEEDRAKMPIAPISEFLESCSRFHAQVAGANGVIDSGCMTIAQLEARVEELEADRKRLDWLERIGFSTVRNYRGTGADSDPGIHSWREGKRWRWTAAWISSAFSDVRAAIDVAMAGEEKRAGV